MPCTVSMAFWLHKQLAFQSKKQHMHYATHATTFVQVCLFTMHFFKALLLVLLLLLGSAVCHAQDTLVLRDAMQVLAKNAHVQGMQLRYTYFQGDTTERYTPTQDIAYVAFQNGARQSFSPDFDAITLAPNLRYQFGRQVGYKAHKKVKPKFIWGAIRDNNRASTLAKATLPWKYRGTYAEPIALLTDYAFAKGYVKGLRLYERNLNLIVLGVAATGLFLNVSSLLR